MRAKYFGLKWWERKLRKYMEAKKEVVSVTVSVEDMERRDRLRAEERRMKANKRAILIQEARTEKSGVKRNLLLAKNFAGKFFEDVEEFIG
jgi:hypothetical protein